MSVLIDLLETQQFQTGLRLGLVALGVGLVLVMLSKKEWRPLPIVGVFIALIVVWTLREHVNVGAFALVLGGPVLARFVRAPDSVAALAAAPGAIWLAVSTDVDELTWVRVVFLAIPLFGYLIADFEKRNAALGAGVIYFSLASLGVFLAVPDTEWALVLIAAAFPVTFLAWPKALGSLGGAGVYAALAVFVAVTTEGGVARPASVVGGLACLGLLVLEPILVRMSPAVVKLLGSLPRDWKGGFVASLPQFAVVLLCSRIAARFTNEWPAVVVVVIVYVVTMAIAVTASSREGAAQRG